MRPVFFADPTDISLRMEDQTFLIGWDLMIVPRWASDVQLPKGIWRSVSIIDEDSENDEYQCDVRVRGGAIVPLGPIVQTTEEITDKSPLTLIVVPNQEGQAEGTLYEDTGDGYGYLKNEFCFSTFKAEKQGDSIIIKCTGQEGKLKSEKRLVSVVVVNDHGVCYGFGDICSGVKVKLETK